MYVKPSQMERKKYCSRKCKSEYQKKHPPEFWEEMSKKIEVECNYCHVNFKKKQSTVFKNNFCSRNCRNRYLKLHSKEFNQQLRKRIQIRCKQCGTMFEVIESRKDTAKYCSKTCLGKSNGKRGKFQYSKKVEVYCKYCGSPILKKQSIVKEWNFCNKECMAKFYSESGFFAGSNSPTWQGGDIDYYGPNWISQRRRTRQRDNYTCQDCGKTEKEYGQELSVHHIIPFRNFNGDWKKANKLNNLISLCEHPCHRNRHSKHEY